MRRGWALALAVVVLAAGTWLWWNGRAPAYDWGIDARIPAPPVPVDNPMSVAKVELGRRLFYDRRLSVNGTMACATCHLQALAFTDGRPVSVGATGEAHPRGAMSLVNVAYASRLTWANNLLSRIEDQALIPLFSEHPVEMGMNGREDAIADLLREDPVYQRSVANVFPRDEDPYSIINAVHAIAAFVRSIVSFDSPYDAFLRGDPSALSPAAQRGLDLFFSERFECFHCHGGFNFTDSSTHENATIESVGFHNNGLYNLDGEGAYPPDSTGLIDLTGQRRDMGRFKAPSLRNVAVTAPYMHDGSLATLDDVLDHYAAGGRVVESGPLAGDGRRSPFKSEFVRGFELTDAERADLLAFLHALTDERVLTDERWSDPF